MRLTCPNCDAQYEVDASMIPASGRDVQCSSCGNTWFQPPEGEDAALAEDLGRPVPEQDVDTGFERRSIQDAFADVEDDEEEIVAAAPDVAKQQEPAREPPPAETEPEPEPAPKPETAAEPEPAPVAAEPEPPQPTDFDDDLEEEPAITTDVEPERRKVDKKVLSILREEATREIDARRSEEPAPLETQTELGLGASAAIKNLIAEEVEAEKTGHPAKLRGEPEPAAKEAPRRDLLPDIDEINSTLTSTSDRPDDATPEEVFERVTKHRSGFRLGFSLILVLLAILIGLYSFSDTLAEQFPAMAPAMAAYVDWANSVRLWFDGLIAKAVEALSRMIVGISGSS